MNKVSVIICVYNTKTDFFAQCLQSVFSSTLKELEVIVVDDGSTVDYTDIIEKYPSIKYIKTKNQGILAARILGAKTATCKYVYYIDSDDTISFDYLEAMYVTAEKQKADIAINDWAFNSVNTKRVCYREVLNSTDINPQTADPLQLYLKSYGDEIAHVVLWNKIYKREILLKALSEVEKFVKQRMMFSEDLLINYFLFRISKCVCNVHVGYYFYRLHLNNECVESTDEKLISHIKFDALAMEVMEQDLKAKHLYEKYCNDLAVWRQKRYVLACKKVARKKDKQIFEKYLKLFKAQKNKMSVIAKTYQYVKLLPKNLDEIDAQLLKCYLRGQVKVCCKNGTYAHKTLCAFNQLFEKEIQFVSKKDADIIIKKEEYNPIRKIMHKHFVYKIANIIAPPGSWLRRKLKAKL